MARGSDAQDFACPPVALGKPVSFDGLPVSILGCSPSAVLCQSGWSLPSNRGVMQFLPVSDRLISSHQRGSPIPFTKTSPGESGLPLQGLARFLRESVFQSVSRYLLDSALFKLPPPTLALSRFPGFGSLPAGPGGLFPVLRRGRLPLLGNPPESST